MRYKALMLDIDGTTIPYQYEALPSQRVKKAIQLTREQGIEVCFVTGRSYPSTKRIIDSLNIKTGYTVVDGGALVYKLEKDTPLYECYIDEDDVVKIIEIFRSENVPFYVKNESTIKQHAIHFDFSPYQSEKIPANVSMIFTDELFTLERTHAILKKLSIPTISVLRTMHAAPEKYSFNITHAKATKLHGIEILEKELGITRDQIIGVGDGYNDFPLLMASGLKVAMGNAIEDLKEIADYIAPHVDDDGVADVIEKFILTNKE